MRIVTSEMDLPTLIAECKQRLHENFAFYLNDIPSLELREAMHYSLANGKHIRPLLVYATGSIFDAAWQNLDMAACAIEMIHTYSLIHDDLPCMDNADLRRGQPTCHKAYSESSAVLAGDGFQGLAFQVLASHNAPIKPEKRIQMINALAKAAGPYGMVSGQVMDLICLSGPDVSLDLLLQVYKLKTGALIATSVEIGRLASNDTDEVNIRALQSFGEIIGLAFQIQDDILDIETSSDRSGKSQNMDQQNNKLTYARIEGIEKAQQKVRELYDAALEAINYLGYKAQLLRELTNHLLRREH